MLGTRFEMFDDACEIVSRRQTEEGFSASTILKRLKRNIRARRAATNQAYDEYSKSGYEGSFLDYIIENWDSIFAIIQRILALFGV